MVIAEKADISISGIGEVRTKVTNELDVSISGSGTVYYKGSPQIHRRFPDQEKWSNRIRNMFYKAAYQEEYAALLLQKSI